MIKTFDIKNGNTNKIKFFNNGSTNYSKILDDIILTNIIKKNDYLFKKNSGADIFDSLIGNKPIIINNSSILKADNDFIKAANFLANYKKKTIIPFTYGKTYTLSDGTPIIFYDDEIQIGFDTFKYSDFSDFSFINGLTNATKKIIINIYTTGAANININLL